MKITQEEQQKGQELYQELVQKAWEDTNFKERLIEDPNAVIAEITGKKASDRKIIVEDQSNDSYIYLNIPTKPHLDELELTEEQLEAVSGGLSHILIFLSAAALGYATR